MAPIRLTYGSSALAWGRDQARSAKVLATEGERSALRALPSAERGATVAPSPAPTPPPPQLPASTSANRFARLLADIASAHPEPLDNEVMAESTPATGSAPESATNADEHLAVAMRTAADRARRAASTALLQASSPALASLSVATITLREDLAVERRTLLEDRARRIALQSPRRGAAASPQLTVSYDQVAYVPPPRAVVDVRR